METKERIGFIGLGKMGQPMSGRLLEASFPLTVWNRTKAKTVDIAKRGARVAASPKEVAAQSDIVITILYDDPAMAEVYFGDNGILAGAKPSIILVDMSTISPSISTRIANAAEKKGVKFLRAPVSGSTNWAQEGMLSIMVSGDKPAYERCQPVFNVLGKKIFYVGANEESRYLKFAVNIMIGQTTLMLAEAATFGKKAGLDWNEMLEVFNGSVAASPILLFKTSQLAKRDFTPGGTAHNLAKDADLILAAGKELGTPMLATALLRQLLVPLLNSGRGGLDHVALTLLMEELAGLKS